MKPLLTAILFLSVMAGKGQATQDPQGPISGFGRNKGGVAGAGAIPPGHWQYADSLSQRLELWIDKVDHIYDWQADERELLWKLMDRVDSLVEVMRPKLSNGNAVGLLDRLDAKPPAMMTGTTGTTVDGLTLANVPRGTPAKPVYDTIPVIMLCQDTAHWYFESFEPSDDTTFHGHLLLGKEVKEDGGRGSWFYKPYFVAGYEVRKQIFTDQGFFFAGSGIYWAPFSYLDSNRKPLDKSILIWQTKEPNN